MPRKEKATGLDASYGAAPDVDRKATGDPDAPPAAATETLGELMMDEAEARAAQADRADIDREDGDDEAGEARRRRAYALWEKEGRPEGRHEEHWHAAGEDAPEPGTDPWTEGP